MGAVTSYTFTNVQANHTIARQLRDRQLHDHGQAGPNGAISPSGAVAVNHGADQAFTITPDACYHVADVLVDGGSVGAVASYTFTNVQANHTIAASFAIDTYTITATAGPNGAISPAGAVAVNYGADQAFTITPAMRLPRRGRAGGWRLGGCGDQLHVHERPGEPHHRGQLRDRHATRSRPRRARTVRSARAAR